MVTRVTAVFQSPEEAEAALKRVRERVKGVYSTNFVYNRISDRAQRQRGATMFTMLPTAVTTPNYLTAVINSPASRDVIPEPYRSRKTTVFIVCDGSGTTAINSILTSMGGSSIK